MKLFISEINTALGQSVGRALFERQPAPVKPLPADEDDQCQTPVEALVVNTVYGTLKDIKTTHPSPADDYKKFEYNTSFASILDVRFSPFN